ncbi:hypothetical protein Ahy_B05g075711 [Arachis hypogaea]|uniref:Protein FAR1-RELATED SEQUENCE n=1 Tax=Arachis hypogaea TaxID=3818 RepID=A0A444Z265_ARAHY|nr:hypothetical protein Ahy_B05g075711 [Arachis hypogaea]
MIAKEEDSEKRENLMLQIFILLYLFRKVQAQFRGKVNCITRSRESALGFTTYEVVEQVSNSTFNKGILCCHSLGESSFKRVHKVSPIYILEQWSKNVKKRHTQIKSSHNELLLEPRCKRFDDLLTAILHYGDDKSHEDAFLDDINNLQSQPHINDAVKFKPLSWTNYELSIQIFKAIK